MQSLAQYVMRGRTQAILVAAFSVVVPMLFWIGAATVGLITLRRGLREGAGIAACAMVPALVMAYFGEIMPLAVLAGMLAMAWVLRFSASWPWALTAAVVLGLAFSVGLHTLGVGYVDMLKEMLASLFADIQKQAATQGDAVALPVPANAEIAGAFGLVLAVLLVLSLMLARWWQALLYNPGGFGAEVHALRLHPVQATGLIAVAVLTGLLGPEFRVWAWVPLVPLVFAGIGLVHAMAERSGRSGLLGLFYAALFMLPPMKQMLVVLAAMDGWLDLRRRWFKPPAGPM